MKTLVRLMFLIFVLLGVVFAETVVPLSRQVTFTVTVNGGTAPFTYQWFKGGVAIAGATANSYVIQSWTDANAGSYTVSVTNVVGTVTSAPVVLTTASLPSLGDVKVSVSPPQTTSTAASTK